MLVRGQDIRPVRARRRSCLAPGEHLRLWCGSDERPRPYAVKLAVARFGFVLRGHPDLLRSVLDHLGAYLPGLVRDVQHPEGLISVQPPQAVPLTIAGVLAFAALVLAGLGWLGAVSY